MQKRSNQDWLEELRGSRGQEKQRLAHQDLAKYLYVVIYNYLKKRQGDIDTLASFALKELAALAQDFVQETLEKLAENKYALLDRFLGLGRFTSWAAQIARNQARQELRKAYWQRRQSSSSEDHSEQNISKWSPTFEFTTRMDDGNPEKAVMRQQVAKVLNNCLNTLPEHYRLAFWECTTEGRSAKIVANVLDTTDNAVYMLIFRAKRKLQKCLRAAGLDRDILKIFK